MTGGGFKTSVSSPRLIGEKTRRQGIGIIVNTRKRPCGVLYCC
jgi:hypothetical protein